MNIRNKPVPFFLSAAAVVSGICIGNALKGAGISPFLRLAAFFMPAALCLLIFSRNKAAHVLFICSLVFLSASNFLYRNVPAALNIYQMLPFEGKVSGKVLLSVRDLIVEVESIETEKYSGEYSGKVLVRWKGAKPPPDSEVMITGKFGFPSAPVNPGQFDWKRYLENRGIFTEADAENISVIKETYTGRMIHSIRNYMRETIYRHIPEKEAGILSGILTGNPGSVSENALEKFRRSGVMHLLAVSGLHVALILYAIFFPLAALGFRKDRAFFVSLVIMYLYVCVTGARPSAMRASVMLTMLVAGDMLGGRGNVYNSLCIAAVIILGAEPGLLFTAGFGLSFLAVFGIIYLAPQMYKYLGRPLAVSVSAVLAILPVLVWDFNYIPFLSPLTNLIVVPLTGIAVTVGMLMLVFSGLSGFLGDIYGISAYYIIRVIELITGFAAGCPMVGMDVARPSVISVIIYYLLLILTGMNSSKRRNIVLIVVMLALPASFIFGTGTKNSFIAVLKNGRSYTLVIKVKKKEVFIMTGRESPQSDTVSSFLYSEGIGRIKHIYLMHPPYYYAGAVRDISGQFGVRKIYYTGVVGNTACWQGGQEYSGKTTMKKVTAGDTVVYGEAVLRITEPANEYLDIRDNIIQAELTGKKDIFFYTGGDPPKNRVDAVIMIEPYKPDWENILNKCRGPVIYLGEETPPAGVLWVKDGGKVFYL
ncbi:MAG: ComEC/Rec2 family competence protein [Elusimicrobiota bacterium]